MPAVDVHRLCGTQGLNLGVVEGGLVLVGLGGSVWSSVIEMKHRLRVVHVLPDVSSLSLQIFLLMRSQCLKLFHIIELVRLQALALKVKDQRPVYSLFHLNLQINIDKNFISTQIFKRCKG